MSNAHTVWLPYAQMQTAFPPTEVISGKGTTLTLADGRQIIDGVASWWTACHGYTHPHITAAIQKQAAELSHVMLGGLIHPETQRLAQRLTKLLPQGLSHVLYSESGSVAVEIAMKVALQYWRHHHQIERRHFIHFNDGYHGDTFYTMSVCCPNEGMHRLFHDLLPQQYCLPIPQSDQHLEDFENFVKIHAHQIAGLIIEPLVQGAGGMKMHSAKTLSALCEIAKRYHVLVIFDEIFTGFGRTGSLFALQEAKIIPDIVCVSKALTGGTVPLAATIVQEFIYKAFLSEDPDKSLMHGTTFMGNALACAAANASLDLFENEPRLSQVARISKTLEANLSPLKDMPGVKDVRVKGAIGVAQLARPLTAKECIWIKQEFIADGVWCRPFGDIVYTTPAFTMTEDHLTQITQSMIKQVKQWSSKFYAKEYLSKIGSTYVEYC